MHLSSPLPGTRFAHRRQRVRQGAVDVEPVRRSNNGDLEADARAQLSESLAKEVVVHPPGGVPEHVTLPSLRVGRILRGPNAIEEPDTVTTHQAKRTNELIGNAAGSDNFAQERANLKNRIDTLFRHLVGVGREQDPPRLHLSDDSAGSRGRPRTCLRRTSRTPSVRM